MNALLKSLLDGPPPAVAARFANHPEKAATAAPPQVAIADLGPQHDGREIAMIFTIANIYGV